MLADALDPLQQVAAPFGIGQADQAHADLDLHRVDRQKVFHPLFAGLGRLGLLLGLLAALTLPVAATG